MKKIFAVLFITLTAACSMMDNPDSTSSQRRAANSDVNPKEALKDFKLGCSSVKAVKDPENGKIYYTAKHNLFKYVQMDKGKDRYFCTTSEAEKAGYSPAPAHFSGSVYFFIQCLHEEGPDGKCHNYASGIFKSLQIYDKVCGNPGKAEIAATVESYANHERDAMDSGKYEGITAALINKYRCRR